MNFIPFLADCASSDDYSRDLWADGITKHLGQVLVVCHLFNGVSISRDGHNVFDKTGFH